MSRSVLQSSGKKTPTLITTSTLTPITTQVPQQDSQGIKNRADWTCHSSTRNCEMKHLQHVFDTNRFPRPSMEKILKHQGRIEPPRAARGHATYIELMAKCWALPNIAFKIHFLYSACAVSILVHRVLQSFQRFTSHTLHLFWATLLTAAGDYSQPYLLYQECLWNLPTMDTTGIKYLGRAWASPTLAWLHCARMCVSMLVCLFEPTTYRKF